MPVLESIISSTQTKIKYLRNTYSAFKQHIEYDDVGFYNWLDRESMIVYIMTKDKASTS